MKLPKAERKDKMEETKREFLLPKELAITPEISPPIIQPTRADEVTKPCNN